MTFEEINALTPENFPDKETFTRKHKTFKVFACQHDIVISDEVFETYEEVAIADIESEFQISKSSARDRLMATTIDTPIELPGKRVIYWIEK